MRPNPVDLAALADALPRLTGEATKVAVLVHVLAAGVPDGTPLRADAAWRRYAAKEVGSTPEIVALALRDLSAAGVLSISRARLLTAAPETVLSPDGVGGERRTSEARTTNGAGGSVQSVGSVGLYSGGDLPRSLSSGLERPPWEESPEGADHARAEGDALGRDEVATDSEISGRQVDRSTRAREDDGPAEGAPWNAMVAELDRLYRGANAGARMTWEPRHFARLKRVVARHSTDEVVRRARIMWSAPPPWPPPPYDVECLVRHFDRFATPYRGKGIVDRPAADPRAYYGAPSVDGYEDWNDREDLP
jgi:hypothetical protein